MHWHSLIEKTVTGLGFELVDIAFAPRGLVRVFIDVPFEPGQQQSRHVTVDDCATVSHQLSHVLTVENMNYERLEVSSPGLDRPLTKVSDYARFVGRTASIKLRTPMPNTANRRTYQGVILPPEEDSLMLAIEEKEGSSVLEFELADVDKAHLVPDVDFRSGKA